MFAHRKDFWFKRMAVWQTLLCVTVLAFLCRSVIPAGYMPDMSGERDSHFALALCTGGGGVTTVLSSFPDEDSSGKVVGVEGCPFGLSVNQDLMAAQPSTAWVGTGAYGTMKSPSSNNSVPPLPALGPPLGSRAPPQFLG